MSKKKIHNYQEVDLRFVKKRRNAAFGMGVPVPKYVEFIETALFSGYKVQLHEAPQTRSKYVNVVGGHDLQFKVRFSNHPPIKRRELEGSCDFFVGRTHTGVRTTEQAIAAMREHFNAV